MYSLSSSVRRSIHSTNYCFFRFLSTIDNDYQYIERSNEKTDKYQSQLPILRIPDLEKTCERYLDAVRPLIMDGNQLSNTEKNVNHFKNLIGKQLDHELRKKNENNLESHYFHKYWTKAYLENREPILVNVNPFMIIEDDPNINKNSTLRATSLLISFLRYRRSLIDNVLEPERMEMRTFKNLFSTTRMPREAEDTIEYFGEDQKHVVFLYNSQFYKFDVLDHNGNIKPPQEIYSFIYSLKESKENEANDQQSISAFSSLHRDNWAKIRSRLENLSEKNRRNLNLIDSALFIVCLDEEPFEPEDLNSRSLGFLHGTYKPNNEKVRSLNRWFDKSIQLIISKNGDAGINWEHTFGDGVIILSLLNKLHPDSIKVNQKYLSNLNPESNQLNFSEFKLNFDLDSGLNKDLQDSNEKYKKLVDKTMMSVVSYKNMNKNYLKEKNISPDFVFQMAFQLANYKLFTKTASTYEACSTSHFKMGRTENIRSATMETKLACNALAWGEKKFTFNDLREALNKGSVKHQRLKKLASVGEGCDRHLFALKCLARDLEIFPTPTIFSDPTYSFTNRFVLSTSNLYKNKVCSGGYGPVVEDGFGLAYGFTSKGLTLNCSSFENQDAEQFAEAFIDSLQEINNVLERSTTLKSEV